MKQQFAGLLGALFLTLSTGAAQAQINPGGHIAIAGHHNDNNRDLFLSAGKIYRWAGMNASPKWQLVLDPGSGPAGLGIVALPPNDRRCFFWLQSGIIKSKCEGTAGLGDWGSTSNWGSPHFGAAVDAINVLAPQNPIGVARGQVPTVFAAVGGFLYLRRFTNGSWGSWIQEQNGLFNNDDEAFDIHDIGAHWQPGPNCESTGTGVAEVAIAAGGAYQRFTVAANFNGPSVERRVLDNPLSGLVQRAEPIPSTGCSGASTFGDTLFVTNFGQLWTVATNQAGFTGITKVRIASPAGQTISVIQADGNANSFSLRVMNTTATSFMTGITPGNFGNPGWVLTD